MELMNISRMSLLEEISQVVKVPMKFIHVVRNPFDNIATMMLRFTKSRETVREEGVKVRKGVFKFYSILARSYYRVI